MLKILHTADIHLGTKFKGLGKAGDKVRANLKNTFSKIIDLALEKNVDLMLIPGDLFDSNQVSKATENFALSQLSRLKEIPVCVLPGTHDCYDKTSIYRNLESLPSNVFLFIDETKPYKVFEGLDTTVYGRPNLSNRGKEKPLASLKKETMTKFQVAMAHGSLLIPGKVKDDDFPIDFNDIESSEFNYIALGHWHGFFDTSCGEIRAFYSGSPEQLKFGEKDSGNVLLAKIAEDKVEVEKIKVGEISWREVELSTEVFRSETEITKELEKYVDDKTILKAKISGTFQRNWDPEEIFKPLRERFLHLIFEDNTVAISEDFQKIPLAENTILGQFVKIMNEKISLSTPGDKKKYQDSLKLGYALLTGKKIL